MSASAPRPSEPTLTFPTPDDFGEPVAHLIVALNANGRAHIHGVGTSDQLMYLGTQGLNWAISSAIVEALRERMVQFALGPWPRVRGGQA